MSTSKTALEEFVFTLQVDPSMLKTRLKAAVVKGFENELIVRPKNSEYEGKKPKAVFTPTESKSENYPDVCRLSFLLLV